MKDPAYLFYPADFLVGCSDLTMEERGQYITLLCAQHQKGHLSKKIIGLILGCFWEDLSEDIRKKFIEDENGLLYNARLEKEIIKRSYFIEKQRSNGTKGGAPKGNKNAKKQPKNNPKTTQSTTQKQPLENVNDNIDDNIEKGGSGEKEFENAWCLYGKKGNKKTSKYRWNRLSVKDKSAALEHIPKYVLSTPDITYRKNFETYINQEAWNDEIIMSNGHKDTFSGANITNNERKYGSTAETKAAIIAEARELDRRRSAK